MLPSPQNIMYFMQQLIVCVTKKMSRTHQTLFLTRGGVWGRDYGWNQWMCVNVQKDP